MIADLKLALRQLRKAPAFTITALATVAICLGANLAIFAVIDSILLRPLPFPQSDRLVTIYNTYPKAGVENDGSSTHELLRAARQHSGLLEPFHLSRRHRSRRRNRFDPAGSSHARLAGIFYDAWSRSR